MVNYSIEELHELLLSPQFDNQEYYRELFKKVEYQQKRLNAFVTITKEKYYEDIAHVDLKGKLSGIPYALKDNFNTKDILTTASSRMLENYIPIYDAHVVEKLKEHGCCLVGKTSMDELAMGGTNMTALSGPVSNPWDRTRIAGGSSGGSAAIVGSGAVAFALGSDTGDSIRKPAGYCGVVGMKPTWGRVSRYGLIPYATSLDTVGVVTRNVRDMAIVMEGIAGRDERDMTSHTMAVPHYLTNLNANIQGMKIAVLQNVSDEIENRQIKDNFQMVVEKLKLLGAEVENVTMSQDLMKVLFSTYTVIANCEATSNHACLDGIKYGNRQAGQTLEDMIINSRTHGFQKTVKQRFLFGQYALSLSHQETMFKKAQKIRRLIVNEINDIFLNYDLILTPNNENIAPKKTTDFSNQKENIILAHHLCMANFAGTPALTLPSGFVEHMPIAVHLMGRCFEEQTVLNVAYALESVLGCKNQFSSEDSL